MQFDTSNTTNVRIAGNYVYAPCATQGITSYDAGTSGVIIEDNVVDIRRPWGIELYADRNSIVRHNTVRFHLDADCHFSGLLCGQIDINRKSEDPAGTGTQVYDNIATSVSFSAGSTGTAHHNVSGRTGHLRRAPEHLHRLRAGSDLPGRPRHRLRRPQQRHPPRHRPDAEVDVDGWAAGGRGRRIEDDLLAAVDGTPPWSRRHGSAARRRLHRRRPDRCRASRSRRLARDREDEDRSGRAFPSPPARARRSVPAARPRNSGLRARKHAQVQDPVDGPWRRPRPTGGAPILLGRRRPDGSRCPGNVVDHPSRCRQPAPPRNGVRRRRRQSAKE